jgi:8-oxo-dGTP pyrophosphatase MutT (NUDIX family)
VARNPSGPVRFAGHEYPQSIPEPDDIAVGGPAPWAHLSANERRGLSLDRVQERLRNAHHHLDSSVVPGDPAEMAAVADATRQPITRRSAVLVALFEEEGESHVVLTRRAFHLRHHRGEIALPGGASDPGETPLETALREAREEVGIIESTVEPAAWLSPIVTFASGSAIWPVVGLLPRRPAMTIDPGEVDRAFTISLAELVADGAFLEERWRRERNRPGSDVDGYFPIHFYRVPGDLIWGATARVLTELLCIATGVAWPDADRVWG